MIRRAEKRDIPGIIELLHQVDMVHHMIRPELFKPNTTKYDEHELEDLLGDDTKPIFVFEDGAVKRKKMIFSAPIGTHIENYS